MTTPTPKLRPAVFLDRDGTVIREVHHIARPEQVEILPGAAAAIARLRAAGFACVVVSNQSGVGRGLLTEADMRAVQREVDRRLALDGAVLDGGYFCTVAPPPGADQSPDRRTRIDHPDRKPGPGMLLRAARELSLDIGTSWMVGDMVSDILAGKNAGVQGTIQVRTGYGARLAEGESLADHVADDLAAAAAIILAAARRGTSE
ncbi:MAG TPA: HAD-IIIA family hydrolase [Phycisphaerales bacterium]|nr:HAD-IIIA family hydrolase [Phycisphaerales bacterium]